MRTVVVAVNKARPLTHALTSEETRGTATSAVVSGFFCSLYANEKRGHHPALANVGSTDADKNGESGVCLLGEHPSGQRKTELSNLLCKGGSQP